MLPPDPLFDQSLRRGRAARRLCGRGDADFLLARVREDMSLRLQTVNRPFPRALDLGTPGAGLGAEVAQPGRFVVRAASAAPFSNATSPAIAADPDALPFASSSFDLVVSGLALQWSDDLPGALVQARRALAPDGLFLACLIGGASLNELRTSFAAAEAELEGGVSPHVIPFADLRDLGQLLQRAGFALPVTDVDSVTVRYPSMFELMTDLRAMNATNVLRQRRKTFLHRATLVRAAQFYAERFADPDGRVRATFDIIWMSGWAPHESQQKPLAPGSARMPLAEALGTQEGKLPVKEDP